MFNPTHPKVEALLKKFRNGWLLKLFFLSKLPAAWFMGFRLKSVSLEKAEIIQPYNWFSKNPYRSIYFAAQCAAGEFSTGIIATAVLEGFEEKIAILVTHVEAEFVKKASNLTTFTCTDGAKFIETIQKAADTGEGQKIRAESIGTNEAGEIVSKIWITWSFKVRK
jgi:hypothetical protein